VPDVIDILRVLRYSIPDSLSRLPRRRWSRSAATGIGRGVRRAAATARDFEGRYQRQHAVDATMTTAALRRSGVLFGRLQRSGPVHGRGGLCPIGTLLGRGALSTTATRRSPNSWIQRSLGDLVAYTGYLVCPCAMAGLAGIATGAVMDYCHYDIWTLPFWAIFISTWCSTMPACTDRIRGIGMSRLPFQPCWDSCCRLARTISTVPLCADSLEP
jgi:hypothetical protein